MKLDKLLKVLEELEEDLAKSLVTNKEKDEDEDLMDIFESSPASYSILAALERINIFIQAGVELEKEEFEDGMVEEGIRIINKCMKRHSERMGYDYTFELKPVEE